MRSRNWARFAGAALVLVVLGLGVIGLARVLADPPSRDLGPGVVLDGKATVPPVGIPGRNGTAPASPSAPALPSTAPHQATPPASPSRAPVTPLPPSDPEDDDDDDDDDDD